MYSAFEVCVEDGCNCNHRYGGVWRAVGVSLVEAYQSLHQASGYESFISGPNGTIQIGLSQMVA